MWTIYRTGKRKYKLMAVYTNKSTGITHRIYFGAQGYSDFTIHHDKKRRDQYDARHKSRENWQNPWTAGFWAKWILWNKPTKRGSIADIRKRFRLKIVDYSS